MQHIYITLIKIIGIKKLYNNRFFLYYNNQNYYNSIDIYVNHNNC